MADPRGAERFYRFGAFRLHHTGRLLLRDGEVVPLEPKQLDTLLALVEARGSLLTKEELLERVWPGIFVEETNLTRNISLLRKTLGNGVDGRAYIETIPKQGYRFAGEVRELEEAPAAKHARPTGRLLIAAAVVGLLAAVVAAYVALRPTRRAVPQEVTFTQLTDQPGQELYPSLSPDGSFFLYASRAAGNWDIYLQRVGGRNAINLTKECPFDDTQPAFSPDGQRIAFRSERDGGGIFVMGATGESVMRVANLGYHPAWSPDGREIVCATVDFWRPDYRRSTGSRLYVVRLEASSGSARQRLVSGPEDAVQPAWSPHGHRIAYWGLRGGNRDIWTLPARGGQPVPVTVDPHMDWNPVWSPDGRHLYFSSDRGGSMGFWRVRLDEKSGKLLAAPELVTTPSPYSGHLSFSRDGRRMSYVQYLLTANLQKVGFDPVRERVLGPPVPVTEGARVAKLPEFSPDGKWLAFYTLGKQQDISVIRPDGTGLRQLTEDVHVDRMPRWSPDGQRIAFISTRTGKFEIWMMDPDGSGLRQITHESRGPVIAGVWSPEGKRLAYSVHGLGTLIIEVERPWSEQSPEALRAPDEPDTWFWVRSWSPDGQSLAGDLQRPEGGYSGIAVYSLESKKYRRLTESGAFARWLSDGRRLMFLDEDKVQLIDSQSGRVREILSVAPHSFGLFPTLSRDDRWIVFPREVTEADVWLMSLR